MRCEFLALLGFEVMAVTAHEREQAPVFGARGIVLSPTGQEMLSDEPDDMESISHDPGVREVLATQGTVDAGQIHADDAHLRIWVHGYRERQQTVVRVNSFCRWPISPLENA
jgi:hypothetical protein